MTTISFYDDIGVHQKILISSIQKIFRDRPRNPWVGKGKLIVVTEGETYIVRSENDILKQFDVPWESSRDFGSSEELENKISILADEISNLKDEIKTLEEKIKAFRN